MRQLKHHLIFFIIPSSAIIIVATTVFFLFTTTNGNSITYEIGPSPNADKIQAGMNNRTLVMEVGAENASSKTLPINMIQKFILTKPFESIQLQMTYPEWNAAKYDFFIHATDVNNQVIQSREFLIEQSLLRTLVRCSSGNTEEIKLASPFTISLLNKNAGPVFVRYSVAGINPGGNNSYHLKFASFLDTTIKLPANSTVTSNNTRTCYDNHIPTNNKITIYDITFRFKA